MLREKKVFQGKEA